jgi:hypothetical protein
MKVVYKHKKGRKIKPSIIDIIYVDDVKETKRYVAYLPEQEDGKNKSPMLLLCRNNNLTPVYNWVDISNGKIFTLGHTEDNIKISVDSAIEMGYTVFELDDKSFTDPSSLLVIKSIVNDRKAVNRVVSP